MPSDRNSNSNSNSNSNPNPVADPAVDSMVDTDLSAAQAKHLRLLADYARAVAVVVQQEQALIAARQQADARHAALQGFFRDILREALFTGCISEIPGAARISTTE